MPIVPEFQGGVPQVRDNGGGVVAPTQLAQSSFDYGRVLQDAMKPISEFSDSAEKSLKIWNARTVKAESDDAEREVVNIINSYMYDPNNGYFSKKGKNAMDGYQSSVEGMQKDIDKVIGGLQPQVREAISSRLQDRVMSVMTKADQWRSQQTKQYTMDSSVAKVEAYMNDVSLHYDEPEYLEKTWGAIELEIDYQLQDQGWPAEKVSQYKQQQRSLFEANRYTAWAEKDPVAAFENFRYFAGDIDPEVKRKLHTQLFSQSQSLLSEYLARNPVEYDDEGNVKGFKWMDDPLAKTGDPFIDSLSPNERIRVVKGAIASLNRARSEESEDLTSNIQNSYARLLSTGQDDNPLTIDEFVRVFGPKKGKKKFEEYESQCDLNANIYNLKDMTVEQMGSLLKSMKPVREGNDNYASEFKAYEQLQKAMNHIVKQRSEDPVQFAIQNERFGFEPLHIENREQFRSQLMQRQSMMTQMKEQYGVVPQLLSKSEAKSLVDSLDKVSAQEKAVLLTDIYEAVGEDGVPFLSDQLKDGKIEYSIAMAGMGEIDKSGVSLGTKYLLGLEAIENKRVQLDTSAELGTEATIRQELETEYDTDPEDTIEGIFTNKQANEATVSLVTGVWAYNAMSGSGVVQDAVSQAVGNIYVRNNKKIVLPKGMDDDDFEDKLVDISKTFKNPLYIKGVRRVDPSEIQNLFAVAKFQTERTTNDGMTYSLSFNGHPVVDKDGKMVFVEVKR